MGLRTNPAWMKPVELEFLAYWWKTKGFTLRVICGAYGGLTEKTVSKTIRALWARKADRLSGF